MRTHAWLATALMLSAVAPAPAQQAVVISSAPERVAVTVYRDPDRGTGAIDLNALGGFALVSETRHIALPAGRATIRFEGVADGIVPVSAIVEGLPGGTVEKNQDARLLSPAALVDGTLGRTVTLTRTDRKTGAVRRQIATIVAGTERGVVLKTPDGIETLRCSGLPEHLAFNGVPPGLSAKPVLSVLTDSPSARIVKVTLSYLARDFDWAASYVGTITPDGAHLDLFAWLTLANGNTAQFDDAQMNAVAGRLDREDDARMPEHDGGLALHCYPTGNTSSPQPPLPKAAAPILEEMDIVVTGVRRSLAAVPRIASPPEDLGDLKLYRVPMPVTVAPRGQKQVGLLAATDVPFERSYGRAVDPEEPFGPLPTAIVLTMRNIKAARLGQPLPAGTTTLYDGRQGRRLLLGEGATGDRAIGETFRIDAGLSRQVQVEQHRPPDGPSRLTVTNANAVAASVSIQIGQSGGVVKADGRTLPRVDGVSTWAVRVPANGTATLTYRYEDDD